MMAMVEGKAFSVRQPWAWCIVEGYKDIENRTRRLHYRGEIFVHAAQTFDMVGYLWIKKNFPEIPLPAPEEFERGGLVGKCTITGCVSYHESKWMGTCWGYTLENGRPMNFIPMPGRLGLFTARY